MEMEDREVHRAPRICLQNGTHGASPGEHPDLGEGDNLPRAVVFTEQYQKAWCLQLRKALLSSQMQLLKLLTVEQFMKMMMMLGWRTTLQLQRKGIAEYRRYVQSSQCEVSDPDEWADGGREGRDPGADGDGATSSTLPRSWDYDG